MKNYKKVVQMEEPKVKESGEECAICGGYTELKAFKGKKVCKKCISGIR